MLATNIKALLVVLTISAAVFHLARPLCIRYMRADDFALRRQVWFILTAAAFLAPNFWVFALVAAPLMVWAVRRDTNPVALFSISIAAVPPVTLAIPTIGIGALFDMNHARLLALTILLPWLIANASREGRAKPVALAWIDYSMIGFIALQFALRLPSESITNIIRHELHHVLDYILVYYVFSRFITNKDRAYDAMAAFCLASAILAPIALFETMRSWLLYQGIGVVWGSPDPFSWLFRDSSLRAQASAGHSLTFGFHMAIAFGFALLLCRPLQSKTKSLVVGCWMWVGLIAAYSRAPWLTAVLLVVLAAMISPKRASNFKQLGIASIVAAAVIFLTPYGDKILDSLPLVGTIDNENIIYRQRLAETSWQLILKNPLFGDPLVLRDMEQLRQGQGIIDLVNAYASITLFNGFVGFTLFFAPFVVAICSAYVRMRSVQNLDPADAALGATFVAAMLATLFFIGTAGYEWVLFGLLGLTAAYANMALPHPRELPVQLDERWRLRY